MIYAMFYARIFCRQKNICAIYADFMHDIQYNTHDLRGLTQIFLLHRFMQTGKHLTQNLRRMYAERSQSRTLGGLRRFYFIHADLRSFALNYAYRYMKLLVYAVLLM